MGPAGLEPAINAFHLLTECKGTVICGADAKNLWFFCIAIVHPLKDSRPWARSIGLLECYLLRFWSNRLNPNIYKLKYIYLSYKRGWLMKFKVKDTSKQVCWTFYTNGDGK